MSIGSTVGPGTSTTVRGGGVTTLTSTGTQNDVSFSGVSLVRLNNASDLTITGLAAGTDGQEVTLVSIGAGNVYFSHQSGSSSAANRLLNAVTSGPTPLAAGVGTATYIYDGTSARWRLKSHTQGAFITTAYNAGDYTSSGGGAVTVDAADVISNKWYLIGRTVFYVLDINAFSVAAPLGTLLKILIANGWTAATQTENPIRVGNNAALGTTVGIYATVPSSDATKIFAANTTLTTTNWAASANNSAMFGSIVFDVN